MQLAVMKQIGLVVVLAALVYAFMPWFAAYAADGAQAGCVGDYSSGDLDITPNAYGMFSDDIMRGMQEFMREIYRQLSKVFMIGHSLLCYSKKVAYTCIGWESVTGCFAKIPNMNLIFSGIVIYVVGVLMTISIGMYFVDISFKLGFAVLFMPITIALWPFPPTKNKFSENLSIVIKNGMLFLLIAIGVSFAVTLVSNSLLESSSGRDGWSEFWCAIANERTQDLVDSFAFDRMHFLVAAFGLIFAFKILASSVNDYLNYFFSDSVFGSASPMHHMGTQAIGMAAANTLKPAMSFAKDVVKTQTGRAISGLGSGIAAMSTKDGRQQVASNIKNAASKVASPRTYINAAEKLDKGAKKMVGGALKGAATAGSFVLPIKESSRKKLEENMDKWIDKNVTNAQLRNAAAGAVAKGINMYNKKANNSAPEITKEDVKKTVDKSVQNAVDKIETAEHNAAANVKNFVDENTKGLQNELQKAAQTKAGQTTQKVAEGTASVLGNVLKDFGKSMQDNRQPEGKSKHKQSAWTEMHNREEAKKQAAQDDAEYFKSINTYDEN